MPEWRITKLRGEFCLAWEDERGQRRRYKLGTSDPKEAARRAPARYSELTRPTGQTVDELWHAYLRDMHGRAVVETMKYTWKAVGERFGPMEASAITIADCRAHTEQRRALRNKQNPRGIGDGTIHTELGHLRMVLLWAKKHKLIAEVPAIERPPKPEAKDAYLTRAEVGSLMESAKAPHIALAIRLLIGTAARIEAALQLTWDRVDFERGMIQLRNPFDKAKRKGRATISMNEPLKISLQIARKGALTPYVIEWAGAPVKSIKRGLKSAGIDIGRPDVSPHMLRHSAAVWLAEDGHSMWEISEFLGHNDVKTTTRIYAKFSPTHLRKLADSLSV